MLKQSIGFRKFRLSRKQFAAAFFHRFLAFFFLVFFHTILNTYFSTKLICVLLNQKFNTLFFFLFGCHAFLRGYITIAFEEAHVQDFSS